MRDSPREHLRQRDRAVECHVAWLLGYLGYLLLMMMGTFAQFLYDRTHVWDRQNGYVFLLTTPIFGLLSTLFFCLKPDRRSGLTLQHSSAALNFQISYTIYQLGVILTIFGLLARPPMRVSPMLFMSSEALTNLGLILLLIPLGAVYSAIELLRFALTISAVRKTLSGKPCTNYPGSFRWWK